MSEPYRMTIGLEVHVQLKTRSKMFCGCATTFGAPPNTQVCPVCLGLPGVLPVMNKRAYELAVRTALALNCTIALYTKFDRKSYYYPDLPKNYQISQYDLPLSFEGYLEIPAGNGSTKSIGIIRVHLEEDAGKLLHNPAGDSLVDLNRTGIPLMEVVSKPDIHGLTDLEEYLGGLKRLLQYLDVSNCNMEEGNIRVDGNVSVQVDKEGREISTPISEIKNVNSFSACEKALAYEADRLYEEWRQTGKTIKDAPKQTRGWDDVRGVTVAQREKEEASDYRYFPEPDLAPVAIDAAWLAEIRSAIPELPLPRLRRFIADFGLSEYDAGVLVSDARLADYFEEVLRLTSDPKAAANWVTQDLLRELNSRKLSVDCLPLPVQKLAELIKLVADGVVSITAAREVFPKLIGCQVSARELVEHEGLVQVSDTAELSGLVDKVIAENPKAAEDFRAGKQESLKFLVGQVMRASNGKANPKLVNELLREKLK